MAGRLLECLKALRANAECQSNWIYNNPAISLVKTTANCTCSIWNVKGSTLMNRDIKAVRLAAGL